jgi:hypothetical protein
LKRRSSSCWPWGWARQELAHGLVELLGLLEVADVTGTGDHDELRVRDRLLKLACDAERRARVELAPDLQGVAQHAGQQVALVASTITDCYVLRLPERTAAAICSSSGTNSAGGSPANHPGSASAGSNSSAAAPSA